MKTINKILILSFFILFSVKAASSTQAKVNVEILKESLLHSKEYLQYLDNRMVIRIIYGFTTDGNNIPIEALNHINELNENNKVLCKKINENFPEIKSLSIEIKSKLITDILNSAVFDTRWACKKRVIVSYLVSAIPTGVAATAVAKFKHCLWLSLLADATVEGATLGTATGVLPEAVAGELTFCRVLAGITVTLEAIDYNGFKTAMGVCNTTVY